jgi:signal recognition particle subunit SRP54
MEQLELLSKTCGAHFYRACSTDPITAACEIVRYGKDTGYEIIMLDTAGRLHIDEQMMQELAAIDRLVRPTHAFLVVDSMMGQQSLAVAETFKKQVEITGGIITKVDSDAKGGVAFAFRQVVQQPILFMGTGERLDDLEPFRAERIAERMLDLGDIRSLMERAEEKIRTSEQERMAQALKRGELTLQDFADQMHMINSLGSVQQLMRYIPGMGKLAIPDTVVAQGERDIKKWKAILSSMTFKERLDYKILSGSRKQRVARGAGVTVADINAMLGRFEESQQFVKMCKKMKFF